MANWQATLLNSVLTTGSVLVFARDQVDDAETPRVQSGDVAIEGPHETWVVD